MATERKPIDWPFKDPTERYEYEHDWAKSLLVNGVDVGDTLRTSADPDPLKRPTLVVESGQVVLDAIVMSGTKIQYWLSGGTKGDCRLLATVWTAQDRCYQQSFILPIKEI